jgi:hypothetical protein
MRTRLLLALAMAAGPAPASAQEQSPPEERINQVIVYGEDACPRSSEEEIIVCARLPESDRFRIPENLRHDPRDPQSQSWYNRAIELSYVGRTGIGSCSPVGPGGFTGCHNQIIGAARAERRLAGSDVNWTRLVEEARRERLARIEAEREAEEADQRRRRRE